MKRAHREFWRAHPGLVWSNPEAHDSAYIRAALLRPRFGCLLDIGLEFGLERLREEWAWLLGEPSPEVERARLTVSRILRNLEEGFTRAAAGD